MLHLPVSVCDADTQIRGRPAPSFAAHIFLKYACKKNEIIMESPHTHILD